VETRPETTETSACSSGTPLSDIGDLVIVPSGNRSGPLSILVVLGVDNPASSCTADNGYKGCIVGRRFLYFDEHTPLRVPVTMSLNCKNVPCDAYSFCQDGQCVNSTVHCSNGTCEPDADGGFTPDAGRDALSNDAAGEASTSDTGQDIWMNGDDAVDSPGNDGSGDATMNDGTGSDMSVGDGSGDTTMQDTGNDSSGNDSSGNDASGNDASGNDASGNDSSGNDTGAGDVAGNDSSNDGGLDAPSDGAPVDAPPDSPPDGFSMDSSPDSTPDGLSFDAPLDGILPDGNPCGMNPLDPLVPWLMDAGVPPCDSGID
jgi:hypothetical protein